MSKVFNAYERATIKNTAREVARLAAKQEKLKEKIAEVTEKLNAEIQEIESTINQYEANVQTITGGYAASELCVKVERKGSYQNDWVFKYPDTIVPPQEKESTEALLEDREERKEEEKEKVEQNEHLYEEEVTLREPECPCAEVDERSITYSDAEDPNGDEPLADEMDDPFAPAQSDNIEAATEADAFTEDEFFN